MHKQVWTCTRARECNPSRSFSSIYTVSSFRYGNGYTVSLFFSRPEAVEAGLDFVASRFPNAGNLKNHNANVSFRVTSEPPSVIFGHILANRDDLSINDFAVKHTTLDEVFVSFGETGSDSNKRSKVEAEAANYIAKIMDDVRRPPSGASQNSSGSISINLPVNNVNILHMKRP